jgi:hypothetical protein
VCACNTPSRLKRAWYWLKARWINWRNPMRVPPAEPEDWDDGLLEELLKTEDD